MTHGGDPPHPAPSPRLGHHVPVTETTPANLPPARSRRVRRVRNAQPASAASRSRTSPAATTRSSGGRSRRERPYVRMLVAMVVVIVLARVRARASRRPHRRPRGDRHERPGTRADCRRPRSTTAAWAAAHDELVEFLRDLIRIPSINPPDPPGPRAGRRALHRGPAPRGGPGARDRRARPRAAARSPPASAATARRRRAPPAVAPRRRPRAAARRLDPRSVRRRRRGRLRLGPRRRRHEGAWSRWSSWSSACSRAGPAPPAWTRPRDPIPGLRRDVLFTCTADEEAGGRDGAGWLADEPARDPPRGRRPQRVRRRVAGRSAGRRLLPDPGRREGLRGLPDHRPRDVGPRLDAARRQRRRPGAPRSSAAWPSPASRALTPVMRRFLDEVARGAPAGPGGAGSGRSAATTRAAARPPSRALCDPMYARALRAPCCATRSART